MAITRLAIRQAVGYVLREMATGTVGEATTTTITDLDFVDTVSSDERYEGAYIHMTSGSQEGNTRRISAYDPDTGVFTLSRAWTAPTASSTFEVHMELTPEEINRLINSALSTLLYETTQEIDYVEDQTEYDLSGYTWLTSERQITNVRWIYGDTEGEYTYLPCYRWRVVETDGALTLLIDASGVEGDLVLTCHRYYSELEDDDDTTDCPEDWIVSAVCVKVYEAKFRNAPALDARRFEERWARELALLDQKTARYGVKPVMRLRAPGAV